MTHASCAKDITSNTKIKEAEFITDYKILLLFISILSFSLLFLDFDFRAHYDRGIYKSSPITSLPGR